MNKWWPVIFVVPFAFLCALADSLIFGYNWKMYIIGCIIETTCFLGGIAVGYLLGKSHFTNKGEVK